MYSMISFKADGSRVESVNEVASFFGLVLDGVVIIDYFGTVEALRVAVDRLNAQVVCEVDTVEIELMKLAA
jgi:hypothetical protein